MLDNIYYKLLVKIIKEYLLPTVPPFDSVRGTRVRRFSFMLPRCYRTPWYTLDLFTMLVEILKEYLLPTVPRFEYMMYDIRLIQLDCESANLPPSI